MAHSELKKELRDPGEVCGCHDGFMEVVFHNYFQVASEATYNSVLH